MGAQAAVTALYRIFRVGALEFVREQRLTQVLLGCVGTAFRGGKQILGIIVSTLSRRFYPQM